MPLYEVAYCTGCITQIIEQLDLRGVHSAYDVVRRRIRRDVRHRTTSYIQKWAEIEHVSISAFHDVRTTSYDVARSVNTADTLYVFDFD